MASARDLREQVEHDVRFHQLIVEASGNSRLIEIWKSLQVETRTAITAMRTGLTAREIAEMHRPIVDALRRRDTAPPGGRSEAMSSGSARCWSRRSRRATDTRRWSLGPRRCQAARCADASSSTMATARTGAAVVPTHLMGSTHN